MRRLISERQGVVAIEFALLLPLFIALLLGAVQFGWLILQNARMSHVARDIARQLSVHEMTDDEAAGYVAAELGDAFAAAVATTALDSGRNAFDVTVTIAMSDAAIVPVLVPNGTLTATASMVEEGP